ncbi:hypothetical protein ACFVKB_23000 [Rhodococcus sp. NPDC127530]|uniref:hypothetical protein n=1 Tax=unclassified Rhodococcus (in: high G+C Gram-positive bacteria) TaxID=192944 RepID=UPI0036265CE1
MSISPERVWPVMVDDDLDRWEVQVPGQTMRDIQLQKYHDVTGRVPVADWEGERLEKYVRVERHDRGNPPHVVLKVNCSSASAEEFVRVSPHAFGRAIDGRVVTLHPSTRRRFRGQRILSSESRRTKLIGVVVAIVGVVVTAVSGMSKSLSWNWSPLLTGTLIVLGAIVAIIAVVLTFFATEWFGDEVPDS